MKRKNDITNLLEFNKNLFEEVKKLIEESIEKKEVDPKLRVKIKNILENTRSGLDYFAHDIADQYGIEKSKIYFPVVAIDKNINSFDGAIGRNLPGLKKHKKIYDYLELIQPYHGSYLWLGHFIDLVTNTKHQALIPVIRKEIERIKSQSQTGTVSWDPNAVKFGNGVYINGALVNPNLQMPISRQGVQVTKEIWVDFQFSNGSSTLSLLEEIVNNIPKIILEGYKMIS